MFKYAPVNPIPLIPESSFGRRNCNDPGMTRYYDGTKWSMCNTPKRSTAATKRSTAATKRPSTNATKRPSANAVKFGDVKASLEALAKKSGVPVTRYGKSKTVPVLKRDIKNAFDKGVTKPGIKAYVKRILTKYKVPTTSKNPHQSPAVMNKLLDKMSANGAAAKRSATLRTTKSGSTKIKPRPKKPKRSQFGSGLGFGSWWDNTQKQYLGGGEAANPSRPSPYPFFDENDWRPYAQVGGNAYGRSSRFNQKERYTNCARFGSRPGPFPEAVESSYPFIDNYY